MMIHPIDILYLGINMGNCLQNRRFFARYPQAEKDYYDGFRWLIRIKKKYPKLKIAIKHHAGAYRPEYDYNEMRLVKDKLEYIDNKLDSFVLAKNSKMCVSYCSTMILELNGFPKLAQYLYWTRHHKFEWKRPCKRPIKRYNIIIRPAYYLDPQHRNRQFCRFIDDVNIHNCNKCKGYDLEVFRPYRLCSYKQFENKAKEVLCI